MWMKGEAAIVACQPHNEDLIPQTIREKQKSPDHLSSADEKEETNYLRSCLVVGPISTISYRRHATPDFERPAVIVGMREESR